MTDFNEWWADSNTPSRSLRSAFEAGAASQVETLRDKFAGQALTGLCADPEYIKSNEIYAARSYRIADAMLEARKVKT